MSYKLKITATNPKTMIVVDGVQFPKGKYYDLITVNTKMFPKYLEPFRKKDRKIMSHEKENLRFYLFDVLEVRKDCSQYLQLINDGKVEIEFKFGV